MRPHVVDMNQFYEGQLGQVARRMIRHRIRAFWPDVKGLSVLGLGYATPYLRSFRDEAERVIALMPAGQGVIHWPADEGNLVALAEETELPLPDVSIDRVLLVHALENSEEIGPMMREVWRVLASGGRLLVVVPNRRGIWARLERTPFGNGIPYSPPQLSRLLRENQFTPLHTESALYMPPSNSRMILRAAGPLENLGHRWGAAFAGVLVVEAAKQIYAVTPGVSDRRSRRRIRAVAVPGGAAFIGAIEPRVRRRA